MVVCSVPILKAPCGALSARKDTHLRPLRFQRLRLQPRQGRNITTLPKEQQRHLSLFLEMHITFILR